MRLLIVDDEKPLAQTVQRTLTKDYAIDLVHSGKQALFQALTRQYAAIILDLQLPDMSGLELCQELRRNTVAVPILVLSGKSTVESKVILLNAGADDYLIKPFSHVELQARLRALLRREASVTPSLLQMGELELHTLTRTIFYKGKPLALARKEFLIFEYLLKHPNQVVSRFELLEHIWEKDPHHFQSNIVDVHINSLRRKLGRPTSSELIRTVHGSGYRLHIAL